MLHLKRMNKTLKIHVLIICIVFLSENVKSSTQDGCLCVQKVGSKDFGHLLTLLHAKDGSNRMFVVEETGKCHIFYPGGEFLPEPFFHVGPHLGEHVTTFSHTEKWGREPSVHGMAFHPKFEENKLFYLIFTKSIDDKTGERITTLGEFRVLDSDGNRTDTKYFRRILDIPQPSFNLYGGQILFGIDGYLYVFLGDGGGRGDPFENGQNMQQILGKVLRIDVDKATETRNYDIPVDNPFLVPLPDSTVARPEIYAYGLRNPYKCSIDPGHPETGDGKGRIICGDIGQSRINELDLIEKGANYGWNNKEGTRRYCYRCKEGIKSNPPVDPIFEYDDTLGKLVVGGEFYRGCALSNMDGAFVYGDHPSGRLFRLLETDGLWENTEILMCNSNLCPHPLSNDYSNHIYSFGQDQQGEIYILTSNSTFDKGSPGYIYKLVDPFAGNCKLSKPAVSLTAENYSAKEKLIEKAPDKPMEQPNKTSKGEMTQPENFKEKRTQNTFHSGAPSDTLKAQKGTTYPLQTMAYLVHSTTLPEMSTSIIENDGLKTSIYDMTTVGLMKRTSESAALQHQRVSDTENLNFLKEFLHTSSAISSSHVTLENFRKKATPRKVIRGSDSA